MPPKKNLKPKPRPQIHLRLPLNVREWVQEQADTKYTTNNQIVLDCIIKAMADEARGAK